MSPLTVRYVKAAFLCLALGVGLGVFFALNRTAGATWRPLHATLNLWGWVTLLIYGMAYHMLPRFAGRPLSSQQWATVQSWAALLSVLLLALGWLIHLTGQPYGQPLIALGAILQFLAASLFASLVALLLRG